MEGPVQNQFIIRMRGIPWSADKEAVITFIREVAEITEDDIHLMKDADGKNSGQIWVTVESEEIGEKIIEKKNGQYMGERWIEIYKSSLEELESVRRRQQQEVNHVMSQPHHHGHPYSGHGPPMIEGVYPYPPPPMGIPGSSGRGYGAPEVVRLRGLPFSTTEYQIQRFFEEFGYQIDPTTQVAIGFHADGRLTGECWVIVPEAEAAIRKMNKQNMGKRYIEMFASNLNDFEMAKKGLNGKYGPAPGAYAYPPTQVYDNGQWGGGNHHHNRPMYDAWKPHGPAGHPDVIPPPEYQLGVNDCCLRLRGLPYHADEGHIVEFFRNFHLKAILPSTVPVNSRPSGEAYVEFHTLDECIRAFKAKNGGMMDRRYIELFRSSKQEMDWAADGMDPRDIRRRLGSR